MEVRMIEKKNKTRKKEAILTDARYMEKETLVYSDST